MIINEIVGSFSVYSHLQIKNSTNNGKKNFFLAVSCSMRDLSSPTRGCPLQWKCGAFTTGLPEKSLKIILNNENNSNNQKTQPPGGRLDHNAEEAVLRTLAIWNWNQGASRGGGAHPIYGTWVLLPFSSNLPFRFVWQHHTSTQTYSCSVQPFLHLIPAHTSRRLTWRVWPPSKPLVSEPLIWQHKAAIRSMDSGTGLPRLCHL